MCAKVKSKKRNQKNRRKAEKRQIITLPPASKPRQEPKKGSREAKIDQRSASENLKNTDNNSQLAKNEVGKTDQQSAQANSQPKLDKTDQRSVDTALNPVSKVETEPIIATSIVTKVNQATSGNDASEGSDKITSNARSQSTANSESIANQADPSKADGEPKNPFIADIDQDIPEPEGAKRHRRHVGWWLAGVGVVLLVALGGYLAISQPWSPHQDEINQSEGNADQSGNTTDQAPEPENPEDPEKPTEQPPEKEEPNAPEPNNPPADEPMPPIAQRPGSSDYPDITSNKLIALTFDDGPSSATTPRLLDTLKNKNVKVTFFVLGNMALKSPDVVRREAAEGHEVASHTPYHDQLTSLSASQVRAQALEMDRILTDIIGTVPPFTRPPYGSYNDSVRNALGQPLIIWSIDPRDWADRDANIVCSRVTSAAFDGAIILVHDIHATTVDAVPCIIDNLRAQGYQFLTVSELAAAKNIPLVNGGVYGKF